MLRVPLLTDRRCVVMRGDHPLAGRSSIGLAELADQRWVMESYRDRFTAACTNLGFQPRISATVDDANAIQALVAAGLGITSMSKMALRGPADPALVHRPLRDWPLSRTYALLWPDMAEVPAVATVLRAIRRSAQPARPLVGKTVIDTGKYHPGRDGTIPELEAREVTESELLQSHLTGTHVVKAFNNIFYQHLAALPWPADVADRTALPIASASAAEVTAAPAAAQR